MMQARERATGKREVLRPGPAVRGGVVVAQGLVTTSARRDPSGQVMCRLGDASCAQAHSSRLQAAGGSSGSTRQSLLALQRNFGNQYVQRVLALGEGPVEEQRAGPAVERSIALSRGGGAALEGSVRAGMEAAFGTDFSGVRIHTGATADSLNSALNARAFTTGQDIFFRHGAYDPVGTTGRRLLAHELTHIIQQSGSTPGGPLTVSPPGDAYELEADRVADEVMK